jgi:membrane protein involved in colicin uptake
MSAFFRSRSRRTGGGSEPPVDTELSATGSGVYKRVMDATRIEGAPTPPPVDADAATPPVEEPPSETLMGGGRVGEHVGSVIAAAEVAAEKIREEAHQEAQETRSEAARLAEELRTKATEETEAERDAARRLVEDAKASADEIRSAADEYSTERRREADANAEQTIRDAQERADTIADTAAEREHVLLANIAASEDRLHELAESLRGVASSLDDVVGEGDSLEGSLQPGRRGNAQVDETAALASSVRPEAGV